MGHNAAECGTGNTWWASAGRHSCVRDVVRLTPKSQFVWLVWSLRVMLKCSLFAVPGSVERGGPEHGSGIYRSVSVSANRAGARNLWYVQHDCVYISGGPLSALTCCVNVRLLSAIKKISPLIYSQSWVGSWVYTTQAMMTFTLIF